MRLIILIILAFISCTTDDTIKETLLLNKLKSISDVWLVDDYIVKVYFEITDDVNTPLKYYIEQTDCYSFTDYFTATDSVIIEHTSSILIIETTDEIYTFKEDGANLILTNNNNGNIHTTILIPANIDISTLIVCK